MRARTAAMSLVDSRSSLPWLSERVRAVRQRREAAERVLQARVRAQVLAGVCTYCVDRPVMADRVSGDVLCGEHAAAFAYYGRTLVPVEAYLPAGP